MHQFDDSINEVFEAFRFQFDVNSDVFESVQRFPGFSEEVEPFNDIIYYVLHIIVDSDAYLNKSIHMILKFFCD